MSHELEQLADGRYSMMYVGEHGTPWHTFGQAVKKGIGIKEAIVESGLDWAVGLLEHSIAPLRENDKKWIFPADQYPTKLVGVRRPKYSTFRIRVGQEPTEADILGDVGPDYTPYQNVDAFNFFQPFLDSGEAVLDTAGSLMGGKKVWVLARLNRDPIEVRPNDLVIKNLLLANAHDGGFSVRLGFTPVRTVCANTLAMALNSSESCLLRIRHTSAVKTTVEQLREIMNTANAQFEATAEQYKLLASKEINKADLEKYVKIVLNVEEDENGEVSTRMKNIMDAVFSNFEVGDAGVKGTTYWDAYNAVNRRLVWNGGRTAEASAHNLWFGRNANTNSFALKTALEMLAA